MSTDEPTELTIVHQNVWCTYTARAGGDRLKRMDRFVESLLEYSTASNRRIDIVCIQELYECQVACGLFGTLGKSTISHVDNLLASKLGLSHVVHSSVPNQSPSLLSSIVSKVVRQNAGLAIYSRFPIVESSFSMFQNYAAKECMNFKGFLICKLQISENTMFSIATTHFDAGSSSTHRLAQMRQLKQGLEKHQVSVVTGDFNICARGGHSRNEEEYKELVSVLSPYAHVNDASVPTHKIGTLDYVFVHPEHAIAESSKCHVVDSIAKNASDHMALVVEVSLRK